MQDNDLIPIIERLRRQHTDDELVEVKACAQTLSSEVWESVSAFANGFGGLIILGLDETENFKPVKDFSIDKVRDQFVTGIGDGDPSGVRIAPPPHYRLHRLAFEDASVLAIEIEELEAEYKPCYIAARGVVGGSYKRIDDKDVRLSPTEIYAFRNFLKPSIADRQSVEGASLADLSPELIEKLFSAAKDTRALKGADSQNEKLMRLNVIDGKGNVTLAGLLACGNYPQRFFPKLLIDVAVHPRNVKAASGTPVNFLDRVLCEGPIGEVFETAVQAIKKNLRTVSMLKGIGRIDELEIPEVVLREAIANAIVHREYDAYFTGQAISVDIYPDRVEIANPGGLWGGKTLANLGDNTSACRNASLMKLMSFMPLPSGEGMPAEGNGVGIPRMRSEMASRALAEPDFDARIDGFKVTLSRAGAEIAERQERPNQAAGSRLPKWTSRQWRESILAVLDPDEPMSIHDIAQALGRKYENTRVYIKELVHSGEVVATAGSHDKNRKYLLPNRGTPPLSR